MANERDKEILRRVMAEPTFEKIGEAMKREKQKHEQGVVDMLRSSTPQAKNTRPASPGASE